MKDRSGFVPKKRDVPLVLALLLLALGLFAVQKFFFPDQPGNLAVITLEGEKILSLDLSKEPDRVFSLQEDYGVPVSFEIQNQRIRFVLVDCPDHICEGEGFLSLVGQTAICMPNRVALTIREKHEK